MTEISRPWEGRTVDGALGDAGAYSASQWQAMYKNMIGTGADRANRAVVRGVDNELEVIPNSPTAKNVLVESGAALVQGIWFLNEPSGSGEQLDIDDNASGSTRIDVIVLYADYTAQTVRLAVHKGSNGAGYPSLTQDVGTIYEIPLAYITLASGFTSITAAMITDQREYMNIPDAVGYLATNSSGGVLEGGTVVTPTGTQGFTTTGSPLSLVAGVLEARTANGAIGRIITHGIFSVICESTVAVGDYLGNSSTSGQAEVASAFSFARVLVANSGAGTRALCYIDVPAIRKPPACRVYRTTNQVLGGAGVILFDAEFYDNNAMHSIVSNTGRITINVPGIYKFTARIRTTVAGISVLMTHSSAGTIDGCVTDTSFGGLMVCSFSCLAGEYVQLDAQAACTIVAANFYSPIFQAEWVSAE